MRSNHGKKKKKKLDYMLDDLNTVTSWLVLVLCEKHQEPFVQVLINCWISVTSWWRLVVFSELQEWTSW